MHNSYRFIAVGLLGLSLASCSPSIRKADIPDSANPHQEIIKLDADLSEAVSKNIDVFAATEFSRSVKWLEEAKSDQASKQKQEEILEDLRKARGSLEMAYQTAEGRARLAPGLFEARQFAIQAGAAKYVEVSGELQDVDSDVSSVTDKLDKVSAEKLTAFQELYTTLEKRATILTQLGTSQAKLNGAKKDKAEKFAPLTLKKAEVSLFNAESVISANVRNADSYRTAVTTANQNVTLLADAMNTIRAYGKNLSESAALKMVAQNSKIQNLNSDLTASNAEGAATEAALTKRNENLRGELKDNRQDLTAANVRLEAQRAMETARSQFSPDEAEAYQQGENLVIRLKQMNFASGRSDLPGTSLATLAKISTVAKSMNASEIKVEGHTDSVGSESQNKAISEKRASAVASYFKSNGFNDVKAEGFGFQKPIATNKSKEGRAQNRRVDIIITPDSGTFSQ